MFIVADEVVKTADSLLSDATKQESCTVISDVIEEDTLISNCDRYWLSTSACLNVTAPVVTNATVFSDSPASVSTSFQSRVQESILTDSTNVPGVCQHAESVPVSDAESTAVSLSAFLHSTTVLRNTTVSGNPAVSGNNAALGNTTFLQNPNTTSRQTMTVHEYCRDFEQRMWQHYWWMQHVQWMTWAAYMSVPLYTGVSCIPSTVTQSAAQAAGTSSTPAARPAAFQQQPPQQQQLRGTTT